MEADLKTAHERVRRELWAAVYRQAHEQSAQRVRPQFCFTEDADKAVADFDRRFASGVPASGGEPSSRHTTEGEE